MLLNSKIPVVGAVGGRPLGPWGGSVRFGRFSSVRAGPVSGKLAIDMGVLMSKGKSSRLAPRVADSCVGTGVSMSSSQLRGVSWGVRQVSVEALSDQK